MLDGYRRNTQFIVVTHNKGTMSACERLYGVTMETKGVSRHVSVELEDLDLWAERPRESRVADGAPEAAPRAPHSSALVVQPGSQESEGGRAPDDRRSPPDTP